jgi:hypothetical protein
MKTNLHRLLEISLHDRFILRKHSFEFGYLLCHIYYRIVSTFLSKMNLIWKFSSNTGNRFIHFTRLYHLKPAKILEYVENYVGFEVLTAVTMEITLSLDVRPFSMVEIQHSSEALVKFLLITRLYTQQDKTLLWKDRGMRFRTKHLCKISSEHIFKTHVHNYYTRILKVLTFWKTEMLFEYFCYRRFHYCIKFNLVNITLIQTHTHTHTHTIYIYILVLTYILIFFVPFLISNTLQKFFVRRRISQLFQYKQHLPFTC